MENHWTFKELADSLGISVEELEAIAKREGLIDENGNATKFALDNGYLSNLD